MERSVEHRVTVHIGDNNTVPTSATCVPGLCARLASRCYLKLFEPII